MNAYPELAKEIESLHPAHLLTLEDKAKAQNAADVLAIIKAEWARRKNLAAQLRKE